MRRLFLLVVMAATAAATAATATETQWWTSDSPADYARAETRGVVVASDGVLEPGPAAASFTADSLRTAWALAVLADGSVAIAGDHGRIDRWTAAGGVRPWVRLGRGQVLCLARDGDGLLAGTGPGGLVYRISAKGDTTRVVATGERYVWAIAPAGGGAFWAATGTRGRLLRVENGRSRVVFDSDESNLVSLLADGRGGADFGGDSQGRIYHLGADGAVRTLYDAAEDEVRALARGADGSLWAAALSLSAVSTDTPAGGDDDDGPAPARGPLSGGRATLYRLSPENAPLSWWTSPQPLIHALAMGPGGPLVATGNRAGVFRVERQGGAAQLLAPPQAQVTALATGPDGTVWAATSNPAVLWRLGPGTARDGEITSQPLDARRFTRFGRLRWEGQGPDGTVWAATSNPAVLWRLGPGTARDGEITSQPLDARRYTRFGRLRWEGQGPVRFLTRSGNSDSPDTTWTGWQAVPAAEDGGRVASPAGRYLQWKAVLGATASRVSEVSISWREPNLAPRIDDVSVAPQGQGVREGELGLRSESITQVLPGGQKVEYSVTRQANKPIRDLPLWARGLRTLQWHAGDPNGDALTFRVEVRREDGGEWVEIGKDLDAALFTWNTNTLPDGRYRLRVTASDAGANPLGEELTGSITSEPFAIDNTAPAIPELSGAGAAIRGRVEDASSPVVRIEVAVDDGEWRDVSPEGGIADARALSFAVTLPGLAAGEHLVSVRAVDMAGNAATRAIHVKVAAAR